MCRGRVKDDLVGGGFESVNLYLVDDNSDLGLCVFARNTPMLSAGLQELAILEHRDCLVPGMSKH